MLERDKATVDGRTEALSEARHERCRRCALLACLREPAFGFAFFSLDADPAWVGVLETFHGQDVACVRRLTKPLHRLNWITRDPPGSRGRDGSSPLVRWPRRPCETK